MHDLSNFATFAAVVGCIVALRFIKLSIAALLLYGVFKFIPTWVSTGWDTALAQGQANGFWTLVWIGAIAVLAIFFGRGRPDTATGEAGHPSHRAQAQAQTEALNSQLYQQRQFDSRM